MPRSLAVVLVCLLCAAARGEPPAPGSPRARAAAKAHFEKGVRAFDAGDYDVAIAEYKLAYDLSRAPALLFNLAQVYRVRKDYDEALEHYRRYLGEVPKAKNRADVEQRIAELEGILAANTTEKPPAPEPAPEPPSEARAPAPPEPDVQAAVPPAPVPRAPAAADRGAGLRRAGVVTMAAGGALAVASVAFLFAARSDGGAIHDRSVAGATWSDDDQSSWDRGELFDKLAVGTGIGAGAALAGGALLYYLGARADRVDMAFVPRSGGASMVVTCGF